MKLSTIFIHFVNRGYQKDCIVIVSEPPFYKKEEHILFTKVPFKSLSDQ